MAAGVVGAAQIGKSAAALPALQAEYGLSLAAASWFVSVISLLGAVGGAALGWLGQGIGFRRQVQAGLLLIVAMNVAGMLAPGPATLLATRAGEGLGFVLVVLAAPALLPTVTAPASRRLVVGAWGAYMPIGSALGALLVPLLLPLVGWRGAWAATAVLTLGALLAVRRSVPRAATRPALARDGLTDALRSPAVLCLAGVFALYAGQYLAVLGLLPTMLVRSGSMSVTTAGFVTTVAFLANAPGNLTGAALQHRGVPRWVLLVGGSTSMGGTVWVLHDPGLPLWSRVAAAVAFSFTAGVVPSAAFGGVGALTAGTGSAGPAMGMLMQGSSLGQLLAPPLVASATASWAAAPGILSGLAALAVLGGLLFRRLDRVRSD
jgi:predicted MFS family arabinose efflux permease